MFRTIVPKGDALVVDVREHNEWITGHIAGAQHAPLSRLRQSPKAYLQRDKLIFVCAGARIQSAVALRQIESLLTTSSAHAALRRRCKLRVRPAADDAALCELVREEALKFIASMRSA